MNEIAVIVAERVDGIDSEFVIELTIINQLKFDGVSVTQKNIDKIRGIMFDMASNQQTFLLQYTLTVNNSKVSKMKKKANQLVPGDVVAGFHGNRRVLNVPFAARQHGQKKASILLQNVETGVKSHVLWGFHTSISMVSIVGVSE